LYAARKLVDLDNRSNTPIICPDNSNKTANARNMSPCRSLLFVPASKPEIFPKALAAGADVVCVDLEDAVGPSDKDKARPAAIAFLQSSGGAQRAVRINSLRSRIGLQDILAVQDAPASNGVLILPKAESADEVRWGDELLRGVPDVRLAALVETARGLKNCFGIASASSRLDFLIFGAVDLAADMSLALEDQSLAYARGRLSHAAHCAGVGLLDVPCIEFRDLAEVERQAALARKLGFTGKAAIHPTNVAVINRVFTPSPDELNEARGIVAAFHQSKGGVAMWNGKLVEEPIAKRMLRLLETHGETPAV
jgi:citrate lyase subunit beta/citryl-CoA lyase/(S)-citramalyl-CoA lyase